MKNILLGIIVIFLGCGRTKVDQIEKAINIPVKKITYSKSKRNSSDIHDYEMILALAKIKESKERKTTLYYSDAVGNEFELGRITIYDSLDTYIKLLEDTCRLVGQYPPGQAAYDV